MDWREPPSCRRLGILTKNMTAKFTAESGEIAASGTRLVGADASKIHQRNETGDFSDGAVE